MSIANLNQKELLAFRYIRNSIIHGQKAPSIRDLMEYLEYSSPRSAKIIIDKLIYLGFLKRDKLSKKLKIIKDPDTVDKTRTIDVPLVGCVPCGVPLLAEENIEMTISVSSKLAKPPYKYFFLKAIGNSMDKRGINNGDLVLIRKQSTANRGDTVVALIDDEATIKEFQPEKNIVILKPHSSDKNHKPIIVSSDFEIQGKFIMSISNPMP